MTEEQWEARADRWTTVAFFWWYPVALLCALPTVRYAGESWGAVVFFGAMLAVGFGGLNMASRCRHRARRDRS